MILGTYGLVVVVVVVEDDDEGGAGDTCTCVGGSFTLVEVHEKHPVVATQLPMLIVRMKIRCSGRFIGSTMTDDFRASNADSTNGADPAPKGCLKSYT